MTARTASRKPRRESEAHPDRVLFRTGFTRNDVARFYAGIAPYLLPHLRKRPLSFRRFPGTVDDDAFWEKDAPSFTPSWIETYAVPRRNSERPIDYIVIGSKRGLEWLARVGAVELHPFLHKTTDITQPTHIVFDLDPGAGATLIHCSRVAELLRDHLTSLGLDSFVKVSGSKGLQVHVPLNTRTTHEETEAFARLIADELARRHPGKIVARMARELRRGRVFIDYSQNAWFKTTVAVYSLRAKRERPFVSMPVTWEEIASTRRASDIRRLELGPDDALARLEHIGDLFSPLLSMKQHLPAAFVETLRGIGGAGRLASRDAADSDSAEVIVRGVRLPRRRSQSGRRLFVVPRTETGDELWLDQDGEFRRFILRPDRDHARRLIAVPAGAFATDDAWYRGEVQREYRATVSIEDIGSYEVIEGTWSAARLDLWFTGNRLSGEWVMEKIERSEKHRSWSLTPA